MTIFKATVKASFYVEADTISQAAERVNRVIGQMPNADCNIKATKLTAEQALGHSRTRDRDTDKTG